MVSPLKICDLFVTIFDFSTGFHDDLMQQICNRLPRAVRRFAPEDLLSGLELLRQELPLNRRQFVVFFGLTRARRLTMMGNAYTGGSPKDLLVKLFQDGPENGMNFIVWANSVESFNDHYAATMGMFEHRLVGNIGDGEYKTFLGESAPNAMNMNNAVYFNADEWISLAKEAGIRPGSALAYLIAPPLEAMYAMDAALKAADVKLCKLYAPPSETNFGGGLLSGTQSACEAACGAFAEAVKEVAARPVYQEGR